MDPEISKENHRASCLAAWRFFVYFHEGFPVPNLRHDGVLDSGDIIREGFPGSDPAVGEERYTSWVFAVGPEKDGELAGQWRTLLPSFIGFKIRQRGGRR